MRLATFVLIGCAAALVLGPVPAVAQRIGVEGQPTPRERRLEIVPPPLQKDVSRPTDGDFYPEVPRVRHDPAFIEPFAAETADGRFGLAGWTAPQAQVGPAVTGRRDVIGWLAVGISYTWGRPPAPPRRAR